MKRYWAKLKKIDIKITPTIWYVNESDFKRGIKNHGNWEITDMGVDDISGCNCDCCEHFSIWEAGGCNIGNGGPICTHKDVKRSGYPRAIAYHEDVTPDWCPLKTTDWCPLKTTGEKLGDFYKKWMNEKQIHVDCLSGWWVKDNYKPDITGIDGRMPHDKCCRNALYESNENEFVRCLCGCNKIYCLDCYAKHVKESAPHNILHYIKFYNHCGGIEKETGYTIDRLRARLNDFEYWGYKVIEIGVP